MLPACVCVRIHCLSFATATCSSTHSSQSRVYTTLLKQLCLRLSADSIYLNQFLISLYDPVINMFHSLLICKKIMILSVPTFYDCMRSFKWGWIVWDIARLLWVNKVIRVQTLINKSIGNKSTNTLAFIMMMITVKLQLSYNC